MTLSLIWNPDVSSPSILEVDRLRVRPQCLLQHPRIEALLKHVQVHTPLVFVLDPLCVSMSVEGVHQDQGNIAVIPSVHVL